MSVVIEELDDSDELINEERRVGDKSPIIDEKVEDDKEKSKHAITDSKIVIEELNDFCEEVYTNCNSQDESEYKAFIAKHDFKQTIHLSFQRCLDYQYISVEEYIPKYIKMDKIQSISVQDEKKSLISFSEVIAQSRVVLKEEPEEETDLKSTLNDIICPHTDSFEQVFEESNTNTNEGAFCCKREATPDLSGTSSRQEIYLFIILVLLIFLLIFHMSTTSSQEYSCYGGNSEDEKSSCALDGYVELSRI